MDWQGWYTLAVIAVVFVALWRKIGPPDFILFGGALLVAFVGIISPPELFSGFVNEGTLTIVALFIVAAAVRETGALERIGEWVFGDAKTESSGLIRMMIPVAAMSAFFNNTPIVAMLLPVVGDWCKRHRVSVSRMFMPLSFVAILGGTCTLIGTSTTIVINGLMIETTRKIEHDASTIDDIAALSEIADDPLLHHLRELHMFDLAWVGIPFVVVGCIYLLLVGKHLLPNRKDLRDQVRASPREYYADMQIMPDCKLAGQSIEDAGLRNLQGLFLMEVARDGQVIAPVAPTEMLREGDILTFTGVVDTIVELERIQGLVPVADEGYEVRAAERRGKMLCEAVISPQSPLIGISIRDAEFRTHYNAAVVAAHRGASRMRGRIGDIVLRAGDTLLLQTGAHFSRAQRDNPAFYLVSDVEESRPRRHENANYALAFVAILVVLMATYDVLHNVRVVIVAFTVAFFMVVARCIPAAAARKSIDWEIVLTIGAAFGLGHALHNSGAAAAIASTVVDAVGGLGNHGILFAIYALTGLFAALISSKASVVLMFPIALEVATEIGTSPRPLVLAVAYAGAATFATPLGYPTNLMVYAPGGYRFSDFMKVGLPLTVLLSVVATILIPLVWPF